MQISSFYELRVDEILSRLREAKNKAKHIQRLGKTWFSSDWPRFAPPVHSAGLIRLYFLPIFQ